ncbi:LysR family transcriptional regulator [Nitrosomonas aestuarii]|uniref:LysR family transcriptional regulator n=1 Tax=Nitrosomonas aestuarii TaxID=52441 RepID=UPI000D327172|nr:LysR family transcriptional regulator [Nitrosomonas aestuarii]PTN12045.1 LysR family transcriptional regulator [Nitrosomonas aestuarii]
MGQFEDMHVFIRVVDAGGIGRAAEQLGLAKSAVSRKLADLETRLGVRLLNRTTRTSSLTEAGRTFYERSIKIVDDIAELNTLTKASQATLEGTINLAAPLSFGLSHLAPAIDSFIKLHPELTININFSDRQVDLVEEGMDLALRIADLKDSSLVARKLSPIRTLLCASPHYLQEYGTPKTVYELKQHRLLHYNLSNTSSWKFVDKQGAQHSIPVSAKIVANNGDFLKDMAIAGHGIIMMPTFITWKTIVDGKLVPIMPDYQSPSFNAYAVYPQKRYLSHRTKILIDFLAERFGDNPYWDEAIKVYQGIAD